MEKGTESTLKMIRLNSLLAGLIMVIGIETADKYGPGIVLLYIIWSLAGILLNLWFFWLNSLTGILISQIILVLTGLLILPFDSYYLISSFLPFNLSVWFSILYSDWVQSRNESEISEQEYWN